ncbi:MAG: hypothetical protein MZV70_48985 [Desulfobacterales bacterium]|nr:hypothetical protein [Desulfobacterales bacterium]
MAERIIVDPITRIEGHLRDRGRGGRAARVVNAWSSGHDVPRHRNHPAGARPARRLGVSRSASAASARYVHGICPRCGRSRTPLGVTDPGQRPARPQPDASARSTCTTTSSTSITCTPSTGWTWSAP